MAPSAPPQSPPPMAKGDSPPDADADAYATATAVASANTRITTTTEAGSIPVRPSISLQPASKQPKSNNRIFRKFRAVFRSFPIIAPSCKFPATLIGGQAGDRYIHGGTRITGTLFGHRKARINLAFQESPKSLPFLLLELAIPTAKLLQDMGTGLMRIAFECEKHQTAEKTKIVDEPIWTLFCNGKKNGYGVKREASEDDLNVMQLLHAVSTGVGLLPPEMADPQDGDLSYTRAYFERVVGSKDSETYYMMMPEGNNGPELTVFFVRV